MHDPALNIRPATLADAEPCGHICFNAFETFNTRHGFANDLPSIEAAIGVMTARFSHPYCYSVVAESEGRIIGSNCLDERSLISGVGPITIDPEAQNRGVGRALMQAVIDRAAEQGAPGVRLVQAAFHNRSLSLYADLGFVVREPLACMQGRTTQREVPGCTVRPASATDIAACNGLSLRIHGFNRGRELADGIRQGSALVVEREGCLTAYASGLAFLGHVTAETNLDLEALIASADSFAGPGILIPTRNSELFRWCLAQGLRVVQPMTLMSTGLYNSPAGAWIPSVTF